MKINRRNFISTSAAATTGLSLSSLTPVKNSPKQKEGFELLIYATRWGHQGSYDDFCRESKAEGYDGIEDWLPGDVGKQEELLEAVEKHDLRLGVLAGSGGNGFDEHFKSYKKSLDQAISVKPDFINSHAGKDHLTSSQKDELIELGISQSKKSGIPIYQESHRGRILFAAHEAHTFINKHADLRLTLDISHWCNVAESLLDDQKEAVKKALERTDHVHSRIGHEEGPQVSDPRAPEWQRAVDRHYEWWDEIIAMKKERGERITMTTEFGPPHYMWSLPYTQQPLSDQWKINVHMMNEWKKRYL